MGEEGITDRLMLRLRRTCTGQIVISKFSHRTEGRTTGADWEWWFCTHNQFFGMRIQAKKLNASSLRYDGLDHAVPGTQRKQIDLLINDANAQTPRLYPLYCFYNYWKGNAVSIGWNCTAFPSKWNCFGCSICDAHVVKHLVDHGEKNVSTIGELSYPWMCLVCGSSYPESSLPERARGVAEALSRASQRESPEPRANPVGIPDVVGRNDVPSYVTRAMESGPLEEQYMRDIFEKRPIDGLLIVKEVE
jgi:hypothetical protein